jgi:hypothetical protein
MFKEREKEKDQPVPMKKLSLNTRQQGERDVCDAGRKSDGE